MNPLIWILIALGPGIAGFDGTSKVITIDDSGADYTRRRRSETIIIIPELPPKPPIDSTKPPGNWTIQ